MTKRFGVPETLNISKEFLIGLTTFFLPIFLSGLGFGGLEIGILISSITVVALFSAFPIGIVNDLLSTRYVMCMGLILEAAFFYGITVYTGFFQMLFLFLLGALGGSMIDTSIRGITYKTLQAGAGGTKVGIYHSLHSAGLGLSMVIGGAMLQAANFTAVLLLTSVLFLVLAAFTAVFLRETACIRFPLGRYRNLLKRSNVAFFIPLFIFGMHWGAENTSYSLFLRNDMGLGLGLSGIYMGVPIMVMSVSSYVMGRHIDRKSRSHMSIFLAGLIVSGLGHILMTIGPVPVSFMFRVAHEIGDAASAVGYYFLFSKVFRKESASGETGFAFSVIMLGGTAGALIFGPLGYAYGFAWPLIISGILSLVSAAFLFLYTRVYG